MYRKKVQRQSYFLLILSSVILGILCSFLAYSLKNITEFFEDHIFEYVKEYNSLLYIILPTIGITSIYFLRKYLFQNKKNKGISEIYKTLDHRKDHLAFYKVPSHYINGFLTVIFGGSTGVEVSTVVATAAVGNTVYKTNFSAKMYKRELVCAGVTAGIAILFNSPIAGFLFAVEVISRKLSKTIFISCLSSALVSFVFLCLFKGETIISAPVTNWAWMAIPFMLVLSLMGSLLSIYFTILLIKIKSLFSGINNNFIRVNAGALLVGISLFFFPFLYGDSYHSLNELIHAPENYSILLLLGLGFLKPLISALTLGAGGDGGVFAPSIVAGAFMGFAFASACNYFFGLQLDILNFMLIGGAATLSASIYAPFTTLFLICNIAPNGFELFFPLLLCCLVAHHFSRLIFPYNVYTYQVDTPKA